MMTTPPSADRLEGLESRHAAIQLVEGALSRRGGLDEAMNLPAFSALEDRDRALARMLAMTVLRRLGAINHLLAPRLRKPPPEPVLMLLRLGLAQARYLDTPAFAAVDTTVSLAERDPIARPFKGLINAVLRGLLRDAPAEPEGEAFAPAWLFARWRAAYGEAGARAMAAMIIDEPAFDLTPRDPADAPALADLLQAEALPGGSLRLRGRGDVAQWPDYASGRWWVQDAAAALPARLLDVKAGESGLDLCAAPGGKTLQLASAGGRIVAVDRSASRLKRLAESLARTGLAADVVVADATRWSDARGFDAVLLDAPCSATGTFRRHPDVLWGCRPGDIAQMASLQTRLLDASAERVKPGGRLIYCVCSLEPEEGESQITRFLRHRPDFRIEPIRPDEAGAPPLSVTPAGLLRILPHHRTGGLDGFFIARLVRSSA